MVYVNFTNQGPMINLPLILRRLFVIGLSSVTIFSAELNAAPDQDNSVMISKGSSPSIAVFTSPKGWLVADKNALSPHIKIMVIGPKLQNEMPPTMNLMIEPYNDTLKSYLKSVKKINDSHGDAWKDLGTLKTKAGDASLSQVEIRSKWGGEKLMHAIIVKNGYAYVLTATAAKNEFGRFYQQFYNSLRSLQIYDNVLDTISRPSTREQLENAFKSVESTFHAYLQLRQSQNSTQDIQVLKEQVFDSADFQNQIWNPFKNMLKQDFADLGEDWQNTVETDFRDKLLS